MERDPDQLGPDPVREAVSLAVGVGGSYYVGGDETLGVLNYNSPAEGQPGLWCQWVPAEDGSAIVWDSGEKFYNYVEWLEYLIAHFLKPWGYVLNGEVRWRGEDFGDDGVIVVVGNLVHAMGAGVSTGFLYGEPCGEPCRGGTCQRTLGHGGPHRASGKEREVEQPKPTQEDS